MDRLGLRSMLRGNFLPFPMPFHTDFILDLPTLRRQVGRLLRAGYQTGNGFLLVGGAGGEFHTLETEERKQIAAACGRGMFRSYSGYCWRPGYQRPLPQDSRIQMKEMLRQADVPGVCAAA